MGKPGAGIRKVAGDTRNEQEITEKSVDGRRNTNEAETIGINLWESCASGIKGHVSEVF